MSIGEIQRTAVISECGLYRYRLGRNWSDLLDGGKGYVNFVMLNPSTADASVDDPTIRRCVGYAKDWGYSGVVVTNLFAFRATDPKAMKAAKDPVGPENERHLIEAAKDAAVVVCAWGSHGSFRDRSSIVLATFSVNRIAPHYLRETQSGEFSHPLYLPKDLVPKPL